MHESEVFARICDCDENHSLRHDLRCQVLWTQIYSCTKCKYTIFRIIDKNTCLCNVPLFNCTRLYIAFSTYCALRNWHSEIVANARFPGNFDLVLEATLEFNLHFAPETADNNLFHVWPTYNVCIMCRGGWGKVKCYIYIYIYTHNIIYRERDINDIVYV